MYKYILVTIFCFYLISKTQSQENNYPWDKGLIEYMHHPWVDSVYQSLNQDQRIAQLFWISVENLKNPVAYKKYLNLIKQYHPGGVLFMKNSLTNITSFNQDAQKITRCPLINSLDAEWGPAMRINELTPIPKAMTMGAIQDEKLIYRAGLEIAHQLQMIGIHVNFAPVADVNSNPRNPVIGSRSFGEEPFEVASRSVMFMRGMQDGGVAAVAKHFPGHGNTDSDSHTSLPFLSQSRRQMDTIDLVPFQALIKNGILGVMTAHLEIPSLEYEQGLPSSLSKSIVTDLLKHEMGYSNLIITDAMNMSGVKKAGQPGRVDAMALIAGNDVVESTENLPLAIQQVKKAIDNNELSWNDIEYKCRKELAMKLLLNCNTVPNYSINLVDSINKSLSEDFLTDMYANAITRLIQKTKIPDDKGKKTLILLLEADDFINESHPLDDYTYLRINANTQYSSIQSLLKSSDQCYFIIGKASKTYTLLTQPNIKTVYEKCIMDSKTTIVFMGTPYQLNKYESIHRSQNLIITYEENKYVYRALNRLFNNEFKTSGLLPVSVSPWFQAGLGL